jgi:hypothetical protein
MRYSFPNRTDSDIAVYSFADQRHLPIANTPFDEQWPQFSPDGQWIVYQSDESGRPEIYVQHFPPNGLKFQVSTQGGTSPRWRGDEIFFMASDNNIMATHVDTADAFRSTPPETLFRFDPRVSPWGQFDLLPDGNILVNSVVEHDPRPLTLVLNWWRRLGD